VDYRADGADTAPAERPADGTVQFSKREFWGEEHPKFVTPHFRMVKCARLANRAARGRECDLLDVGCGPGSLSTLLAPNISYYGIDIAVRDPAANLIEADLIEAPIRFGDQVFDIVVAQGFFEYAGTVQEAKFAEISQILRSDGTFIISYTNFGHRDRKIYGPYSNVRPLADFRSSLARYFRIDRAFPVSHNWSHGQPVRPLMKALQGSLNANVPLLSPVLAVEYFFICSPRPVPVRA
jgi:SAM-dependent methyltransferase